MVSGRAILHEMARRERTLASVELGVHSLAHQLGLDVADLEDQLAGLAKRGLVATCNPEEEVVRPEPRVHLTERGRARALALN